MGNVGVSNLDPFDGIESLVTPLFFLLVERTTGGLDHGDIDVRSNVLWVLKKNDATGGVLKKNDTTDVKKNDRSRLVLWNVLRWFDESFDR